MSSRRGAAGRARRGGRGSAPALSTLLWLTRAANPRGITALPPRKYAARFEEFMLSEVLALPTSWRDSLLSTWRPWR